MIYLARINIGAGGTWQKHENKDTAVANCIRRAKEDWSGMFDLDAAQKAGELKVNVYEDGGTDSFDDDVYLETVTA